MYIQQSDLFWGMNRDFVKKIMGFAEKESYEANAFLFHVGDPAAYFYILIKGRVKLIIGDAGPVVYIVDHAGEAFGWSSLIGRDVYSASGQCLKPTTLQKFDRRKVQMVIEKDPTNGLIFFKRLAAIIGNRLLWSYKMITATSQGEISPSFGTGQVQQSEYAA